MKKKKGFTLVELLVVIAILAVLASVSVVGYLGFVNKANLSADQSEVDQVNTALKALSVTENLKVENSDDLNSLVKRATDNTIDLDTFALRSSDKGYNLFYNTDTNELEIINGLPEAKQNKEAENKKNARAASYIQYNNLDGFAWTVDTPYLYVQRTGKFAEFLKKLNSGEYNLRNINEWYLQENETTEDFAKRTFGKEAEYFNKLLDAQIVYRSNDVDKTGVKLANSSDQGRILIASSVESLNDTLKVDGGTFYIPSNITTIATGTFYDNNTLVNYYTINPQFNFEPNVFGKDAEIYIETPLVDETGAEELLKSRVAYSKNEIDIHYDGKTYQLLEDKLTLDGVGETIESETSEVLKKWCDDVTALVEYSKNNKYDIYSLADETNPQKSRVQTLHEEYEKMNLGQKDYVQGQAAYGLFYNDTKVNEKPVLNDATGLYHRHVIYQEVGTYILEQMPADFSIEEFDVSGNYSLLQKFNEILATNANYSNIKLVDFKSENDFATAIYLNNIFTIRETVGTSATYDDQTGNIIDNEIPGQDTIFSLSLKYNEAAVQDKTIKAISQYGITSVNIISKMHNEAQDVSKMPYYGSQNSMFFYVDIQGKIRNELTPSDFTITIQDKQNNAVGNNVKSIQAIEPKADKTHYLFEIELTEESKKNTSLFQEDNYCTLTIQTKKGTHANASLKFRFADAKNIHTDTDLIGSHNGGTYVLNNSIVFDDAKAGEELAENGVYYGKIPALANPMIDFVNNSKFYGNGYTVDGSKINIQNEDDNSKSFIRINNSEIANVHVKLAMPKEYNPSASFNVSATGINVISSGVIRNCKIENAMRGVRILGSSLASEKDTTIENCTFVACAVAIELHSDGSSTKDVNINIKNTHVNPNLNQPSGLQMGIGLLFFPGSRGKGITTFHHIHLKLDNYKYYGWFDFDNANEQVKQMIEGVVGGNLGSIASSVLDLKSQIKDMFNNGKGKFVYNNKMSPSILVPTHLYVKALGKEIPDSKLSDTMKIESSQNEFLTETAEKSTDNVLMKYNIEFQFYLTAVNDEKEPVTYNLSNMPDYTPAY